MENPVLIEFSLLAKARFSREFGGNKEGRNTLKTTQGDKDA